VRFDSKNESKEVEETPADKIDVDLLAAQLSEMLNNPALPENLFNTITDQLTTVLSNLTTSPELIKANLLGNDALQTKSMADGSQ
jgi:hypothetical protein